MCSKLRAGWTTHFRARNKLAKKKILNKLLHKCGITMCVISPNIQYTSYKVHLNKTCKNILKIGNDYGEKLTTYQKTKTSRSDTYYKTSSFQRTTKFKWCPLGENRAYFEGAGSQTTMFKAVHFFAHCLVIGTTKSKTWYIFSKNIISATPLLC